MVEVPREGEVFPRLSCYSSIQKPGNLFSWSEETKENEQEENTSTMQQQPLLNRVEFILHAVDALQLSLRLTTTF